MKLDTPEITKQGSRYGVKLKATAPSIHIVKAEWKRITLKGVIEANIKSVISNILLLPNYLLNYKTKFFSLFYNL